MPKRSHSGEEPARPQAGLLMVRFTANATLDTYLDLKSVSNLRASCYALGEQYHPDTVPNLWANQSIDPVSVLSSPNLTVQGATLLQRIYKFTAISVRRSSCVIFGRASVSGDCELAKWYHATYGIAGLIQKGLVLVLDPLKYIEKSCELGNLSFTKWMFEIFGLEMSSRLWSTLMLLAASSCSIEMIDWVNALCPPGAKHERFARGARSSVLQTTHQSVLMVIVKQADVAMLTWAQKAFACSREMLNWVVFETLRLKCRNEVAHYILRQCRLLGRGPYAEKIRVIYEEHPALDTWVCPLPVEPADSVFDPEDAADMALLPDCSSEEIQDYSQIGVRLAIMDAMQRLT